MAINGCVRPLAALKNKIIVEKEGVDATQLAVYENPVLAVLLRGA
jgi:hypothetical protein